MYKCKCVKLKFSNMKYFKLLYNTNSNFNSLNENYFPIYNNSNFIKKLFLMNQVTLLKNYHNTYIGYMWKEKIKNNYFKVKALNVIKTCNTKIYNNFFVNYPKGSLFSYKCQKNNFNHIILSDIGFKRISTTIEMLRNINAKIPFSYPPNISFKKFIINKDENLRCYLQNNIFYKKTRPPLSIDDIYFEEKQKYFHNDTCFFIHDNEKNITFGYGQIIFKDNGPVIVNFGILKNYRGHGYGKAFLIYLLNCLYKLGYHKTFIEVDYNNTIALNLYNKLNFNINREISKWELKK